MSTNRMSDAEVMEALRSDTPLNRARKALSSACGRIEQAGAQRRPAGPVEIRRMEFEAVTAIAAELHSAPTPENPAMSLVDAFEMGFAWASSLRGQTLEDSRAVGRTLLSDAFDPIGGSMDLATFDSFKDADHGICEAKRIIHRALERTPPCTGRSSMSASEPDEAA